MGCRFLLQGIFPTQESNPGLLHCTQILYPLSYKGSSFTYICINIYIYIYIYICIQIYMGFPSKSAVGSLSAMQEMQVQSLGQEDTLKKRMATLYSILP